MPGSLPPFRVLVVLTGLLAFGLAGCGGDTSVADRYDRGTDAKGTRTKRDANQGLGGNSSRETGTLFGPGGLFGSKAEKGNDSGTGVAA